MEQVKRIELSLLAWKANVLPLNYTCIYYGVVPRTGVEPARTFKCSEDFKSSVSTIPPPGLENFHGDPEKIRTSDLLIKSQLLYRLSYEVLAGKGGFEPPHDRVKVCCLTTWLLPNQCGGERGIRTPELKKIWFTVRRSWPLCYLSSLCIKVWCWL